MLDNLFAHRLNSEQIESESESGTMGCNHGFYIRRMIVSVRTYGVAQAFRFVEGIWSHRQSRQIRFFSEENYFTSYVRNMFLVTI